MTMALPPARKLRLHQSIFFRIAGLVAASTAILAIVVVAFSFHLTATVKQAGLASRARETNRRDPRDRQA